MASSANSSLPSGKKWYSDEKRASAFVRIYYQEDFEDTHKSQKFAEHLAQVGTPG